MGQRFSKCAGAILKAALKVALKAALKAALKDRELLISVRLFGPARVAPPHILLARAFLIDQPFQFA